MHLQNVPLNYRTCIDTVKHVYTESPWDQPLCSE